MKCKRFHAKELDLRENCPNCQRWSGSRCNDEKELMTDYEDSEDFKRYEKMMQNNKGVRGPL